METQGACKKYISAKILVWGQLLWIMWLLTTCGHVVNTTYYMWSHVESVPDLALIEYNFMFEGSLIIAVQYYPQIQVMVSMMTVGRC